MRKLFNSIFLTYAQDESGLREMKAMHDLAKEDIFAPFIRFFLTIQGKIAQEMLEQRFTKLSPEEKDVRQRTYANIYDVTNVLLDPKRMMPNNNYWEQHKKVIQQQSRKNQQTGTSGRRS